MGRGLLVFIGITSLFIISQTTELRPYIAEGNLTCFECPAGFYLSEHCTINNTISTCVVCPQGYYSNVSGVHTSCARCSLFCESGNLIISSNCSSTTNLICGCPPGKVLKNPHDKYRAICEDPPNDPPTKTKENCSHEAAENTEVDHDSGTSADVGCINYTNANCPAQEKCTDTNNGLSLNGTVLVSGKAVIILLIVIGFCALYYEMKRRRISNRPSRRTNSVPNLEDEKLRLADNANDHCEGPGNGEDDDVPHLEDEEQPKPNGLADNENDHCEGPGNGEDDEQTRDTVVVQITSDDTPGDESVQPSPTSTTPPSIDLPSATGSVGTEPTVC